MKKVSRSKGILIFYGFDILLFVVLLIAFIPAFGNRKTAVESAVLNPKYADKIQSIQIDVPFMGQVNSILLEKYGSVWIGTDESRSMYWPADSTSVNNMIQTATKLVKMYKKSDNQSSWHSLSVYEENARRLTFYGQDGQVYSRLYYGVEDPITQRIAVRSDVSISVMETENKISTYLTPEQSFWCDPFIYPQIVTGYSREKSEEFLRRGQLVYSTGVTEPAYELQKTFDNESKIILRLYENSDTTYTVVPEFTAGPSLSDEVYRAIAKINYSYSISQWTCEKLLERIGR